MLGYAKIMDVIKNVKSIKIFYNKTNFFFPITKLYQLIYS